MKPKAKPGPEPTEEQKAKAAHIVLPDPADTQRKDQKPIVDRVVTDEGKA